MKFPDKVKKILNITQGYFVCIFIPFMLLILYQGLNCIRLFRRYKKEQMQEMEEERAKIEMGAAENARMMEELLALKEELARQKKSVQTENKEE